MKVCCALVSKNPSGNSRTIKVAEALADAGAEVLLVCVAPKGTELPRGSFRPELVRSVRASEHPVWLLRVAYNLLIANPLTVLAGYGISLPLAVHLFRANADVYHAHFLKSLLPAWIASSLRGARLVYDVRDVFADSYMGVASERRRALYDRADNFLARRSDAVVAISQPMAELMTRRYGVKSPRVILNGPIECISDHRPVSHPVRLFFQGHFAHNRNLDCLIRAMQYLRGKATLTLQGWGALEPELQQLVEDLELEESVFFRSRCQPKEVVKCASEYDIGVMCHRGDSDNLRIAVPNKLMDYIGAGLAVAASDLPGARSIVDRYGCGVLIDPESPESMARDIGNLVADPAAVSRMKAVSTQACSELSWVQQAALLVELYEGLAERKTGARS